MITVSEVERSYAETLGKMGRTQLPHLDWDELEPHLMLGWRTSAHAENLDWQDVRAIARECWDRNAPDQKP